MSGVLDIDAFVEQVAAKVVARLEPAIRASVESAFVTRVEGKILDIPALAKRLGKSTDATRMWLKRGGRALPQVELGGGRRGVRVEELEAFLGNGKRGAR